MTACHLAAARHTTDPACGTITRYAPTLTTDVAMVTCRLCRGTVLYRAVANGDIPAPPIVYGASFNVESRALILNRDRFPGGAVPTCVVCGEQIRAAPDVHHRQRRMPGNGRPSNALTVHSRWEGEQCHHRRIHEDVATAHAEGWILPVTLDPADLHKQPFRCAYRGWGIITDDGNWREATTAELGQETAW